MRPSGKGLWFAILIIISLSALSIAAASASQDLSSSLSTRSDVLNVTPGDAYSLMLNRSDSVILDVRTPQEYQSGRLGGAINLDYYSSGFLDGLKTLDKDSTYIVYCRRGIRGSRAMEMMRDLGFKHVYNVLGGLTLWSQEGRPMIGEVAESPQR